MHSHDTISFPLIVLKLAASPSLLSLLRNNLCYRLLIRVATPSSSGFKASFQRQPSVMHGASSIGMNEAQFLLLQLCHFSSSLSLSALSLLSAEIPILVLTFIPKDGIQNKY